ncbi:MAG: purine-nucleoside phosphorylase [Oscillospiraceae bacterium]|nr:purine-nucleoside phosphorylase [Oscillospiraceae bacterium]
MFDANGYYIRLKDYAEMIKKRTSFTPECAVTLGSGLGDFVKNMRVECEISYSELPDFPVSTVSGHAGKFIFGYLGKTPVAAMQGRVHYYEGYDIHDVVLPTRLVGLLGAKRIVLTNAVGSLNPEFRPGQFVVLRDHISSFVPSPLIGQNIDELGLRFSDMTALYDPEMREKALKIGENEHIPVHEGVFVQCTGPQFETPAEIRMYRALGADTVGMSTAVEAIAAHHMGVRVCAVNCVTNMAAGIDAHKLTHEEVKETADRVAGDFARLIMGIVE